MNQHAWWEAVSISVGTLSGVWMLLVGWGGRSNRGGYVHRHGRY